MQKLISDYTRPYTDLTNIQWCRIRGVLKSLEEQLNQE